MKKRLLVLAMAALPVVALAVGESTANHTMGGHQMMQGHDMAGMNANKHPAAAGKPGDSATVSRTIEVTMDDKMRYIPSNIRVNKGETVRFFLKNMGKVAHEMAIGTPDEFDEHAAMMHKMPGMSHSKANLIKLNPGQSGALVWRFDQPGTVDIACLQPGHREAGMVGKVKVI